MAAKIRLKKTGRRGQNTFRLVVIDESAARNSRPIEELGSFNPHTDEIQLKGERITEWISKGVEVSPRARSVINKAGIKRT